MRLISGSDVDHTGLRISEDKNVFNAICYDCKASATKGRFSRDKPNGDIMMRVVLHLRIQVQSAQQEQLLEFLRKARPFYEQIPGATVRLLHNTSAPEEFIEIIEYASREAYEQDRERVNSDDVMQSYLAKWQTLLKSPARIEVYEELTDKLS